MKSERPMCAIVLSPLCRLAANEPRLARQAFVQACELVSSVVYWRVRGSPSKMALVLLVEATQSGLALYSLHVMVLPPLLVVAPHRMG